MFLAFRSIDWVSDYGCSLWQVFWSLSIFFFGLESVDFGWLHGERSCKIRRIQIEGIKADPCFLENYIRAGHGVEEEVNLDDVQAVFYDIEDKYVAEESKSIDGGPLVMNAFEMISLSQGLNLSALFDRRQDYVKRQSRFVSREPAQVIISTVASVAESTLLKIHTRNYKTTSKCCCFKGYFMKIKALCIK